METDNSILHKTFKWFQHCQLYTIIEWILREIFMRISSVFFVLLHCDAPQCPMNIAMPNPQFDPEEKCWSPCRPLHQGTKLEALCLTEPLCSPPLQVSARILPASWPLCASIVLQEVAPKTKIMVSDLVLTTGTSFRFSQSANKCYTTIWRRSGNVLW